MRRIRRIEQREHLVMRECLRVIAGLARRLREFRLPGDHGGARRRGVFRARRGGPGAGPRVRVGRHRLLRAAAKHGAQDGHAGPHRQGFPNGTALTSLPRNASRSSPPKIIVRRSISGGA